MTAGELYDLVDGQGRYAMVDGDQIRAVHYMDAKPENEGQTWLAVKHFDAEQYDAAKHWRLKPVVTVEADHVRVEFPIIAKRMGGV